MKCFMDTCTDSELFQCSCGSSSCSGHLITFLINHPKQCEQFEKNAITSSTSNGIVSLLKDSLKQISQLSSAYLNNLNVSLANTVQKYNTLLSELHQQEKYIQSFLIRIYNSQERSYANESMQLESLQLPKLPPPSQNVFCDTSCINCNKLSSICVNYSGFHLVCEGHLNEIMQVESVVCVHCSSTVSIFKSFLMCNNCKSNPISATLSCGHKLCGDCSGKCISCSSNMWCSLCTRTADKEFKECITCKSIEKFKCKSSRNKFCANELTYGKCEGFVSYECSNCGSNSYEKYTMACGDLGCKRCSKICIVCNACIENYLNIDLIKKPKSAKPRKKKKTN